MSLHELTAETQRAAERVAKLLVETPLRLCPAISAMAGASVYAKLENLQPTGSFKVRGACNKMLSLSAAHRERGIVTASTGNHGAAVAYVLSRVGGKSVIFVPDNVSQAKLANIDLFGADIRKVGGDAVEAEHAARDHASQHGLPYVSPYNDLQIVAGQGTIGLELARQCANLDAVFVALGGGGLTAGLANSLRNRMPETQVIACSASHSKVMMASVAAGRILDLPSQPTLSDGTAGGIEVDSITFEYCRELVHRYVEVSERDIARAMCLYMDTEHLLIEGAAAVAIAAFLQEQERWQGAQVALIICGANISRDALRAII